MTRDRLFSAGWGCIAIILVAFIIAPATADTMTREDGIDRDGNDYSTLFAGDPGYDGTPESCGTACLNQPACNAATYAAHDNSCWLKSIVPVATKRSGVISFVKVASGQTTAPGTAEKSVTGGTGGISVTSNPLGANVYLDGEFKGVSPLNLNDLQPGTHNLLVTLKGYNDRQQSVTVTAGAVQPVTVDFGTKTPGFAGILAIIAFCGLLALRKTRE